MSLLFDVIKQYQGKPTDKASAELQQSRLGKCNACPNKLITGNCKICGCFVKDKVKYLNEECPIKKW